MTSVPEPQLATDRRLTVVSLVVLLGLITTVLDTTIVNIALDNLHSTFHASVADTQWVVTGYLLAYVAVIPVSGWASERFGARRVWMFAVAVFMIGSLLCGLSWSLPALIGFRVLQGIGGGMVLPVSLTILTRAAGKERIGGAIATIGFIGQLAPILGPIIGGSLIPTVGWHWLFFVNVPICLAALALAPAFLPRGERDRARSIDLLGFVLLTPGVIAVAFGASQAAGKDGFASLDVWLPLAIGVALIAGFVLHSLRAHEHALIDVRVFARRSFGLSSVIIFAGAFSLYAIMFLLPLFYQEVRGDSVFATGFLLIPQGLGAMCFILLNRRFGTRVDARLVIAAGVVLTMLGAVPFALSGLSGGDVLLLAAQFAVGFGTTAISLPVMTLAFASLNHDETPRGSAAFSVVQRVGAPFGVTVIAVLLQRYLTGATSPQDTLVAFGTTFWWLFALAVIPGVLALFLPRAQRAVSVPEQPALVD
jgi:EmrB/QacA subfamily drug resistance transporter